MSTTHDKAATYTHAAKRARTITEVELIAMLKADDNPRIYRYRMATRIAMSARAYTFDRLGRPNDIMFIGFDYCNRNGYTEQGQAHLSDFCKVGRLHEHKPTVFEFDTEQGFDYVQVAR